MRRRKRLLLLALVVVLLFGIVTILVLQNRQMSERKKPMTQQPTGIQTQAWIYPGTPGCAAMAEIADGRAITVLKPQYYTLQDNGTLTQITDSQCNGYSPANAALIREYSQQQFITVPGTIAGIQALANNAALLSTCTNTLISFLQSVQFTGGIELDIEGFGQWTVQQYNNYKNVIIKLGGSLHNAGFKLMLDGPAILNATYQKYYPNFKYEDLNTLPIDGIIAMCYDLELDNGVGTPIASLQNITDCCTWMKSKVIDPSHIIIGINSYAYVGKSGAYTATNKTYQQMTQMPGFSTAKRDPASGEMMWTQNGISYDYSDSQTLSLKLQAVQKSGIAQVSIWSLGGNLWPTFIPPPTPDPDPALAAFTAKYPKFDAWYASNLESQ